MVSQIVRVQLDRSAVRELLRSSEVSSFLMEIANEVVSVAGSDYEASISSARKSRTMAVVADTRPEARFVEMRTGNLARALGRASR